MKIDKVTCLCVLPREKEWTQLEQQIVEKGWDYERFLAGPIDYQGPLKLDYIDANPDVSQWGYGNQQGKPRHKNAFMCHQKMLQKAKNENRQNLLILEDDAYITDRFDIVWNSLQEQVFDKGFEWDILYLGWWIGNEGDNFNEKIEKEWRESGIIRLDKTIRVGGLHGCLINNNMFDLLLSLPPTNPIDCQLNYYHNKIRSYCIYPKIIHTKTMWSICEGTVMERMVV